MKETRVDFEPIFRLSAQLERETWCYKNIGDYARDWAIFFYAGYAIFHKPEHATAFALRWC
jgi:hypothetical protein